MPDGTQPVFIRVARCQQIIGIHRSTIYRWAKQGLITIHKRGRISLIRLSDINELMSEGAK